LVVVEVESVKVLVVNTSIGDLGELDRLVHFERFASRGDVRVLLFHEVHAHLTCFVGTDMFCKKLDLQK
jgi:hypothetical protein